MSSSNSFPFPRNNNIPTRPFFYDSQDNTPPPLDSGLEDEADDEEEEKYQAIPTPQNQVSLLENNFSVKSASSPGSAKVTFFQDLNNISVNKSSLNDLDCTLFQEFSEFFEEEQLNSTQSSYIKEKKTDLEIPKTIVECMRTSANIPSSCTPNTSNSVKREEERKRRNRIYAKRSRDLKNVKFKQTIDLNKELEKKLRKLEEENQTLKLQNQELAFQVKESQFKLKLQSFAKR
ncbi:hypothetical protein, no similarity [Geotrichum candidum]|uniref:BZIP domain-containing protein n=1 Tax=Geotrichum candidum TaxID=1173061 RepID=A0A0J9XEX0_GEOCN|nr:hypothetical protein, no similarity [Geotrichum candidum]